MNSHNTPSSQSSEVPKLPIDEQTTVVKKATNSAVEGLKTKEVAGYTILAMPLESMGLTPEQQEKFKADGGITNPEKKTAIEIAGKNNIVQGGGILENQEFQNQNKDQMIQWIENFEDEESEIDGVIYSGFELFKKVYEGFADIRSLTEEEARKAGLYPDIYYRNDAALEWFAKMHGGHLATLDTDDNGELYKIGLAMNGETNLEKLASIGQAPFGLHSFGSIHSFASNKTHNVYGMGYEAIIVSGSSNDVLPKMDKVVHALKMGREKDPTYTQWGKNATASGVVVLNK